ncbi:hypothetical protein F0249_19175 [Vibrio sp. 03-59-1]|uniref:rolling circle replication-associated protein n=1 Tax=Vibrio sp. 03-59-1 TaxID=2607607 RepID=UPI00149351EA|nr:hypothetical protein [Vibrio sp. 03-59-1]NOH85912.1 hypothetical protein [Vibrio sp. 03-59-1]
MNHLYEPQPEREIANVLSIEDVKHVTALAQDVGQTDKNIAALESGFFSAPNNDWLESENQKLKIAEQLHFLKTVKTAEAGELFKDGKLSLTPPDYFTNTKRGAHGGAVERLGSSKGAKVGQKKHARIKRLIDQNRKPTPRDKSVSFQGVNYDNFDDCATPAPTGWIESKKGTKNKVTYVPKNRTQAFLMQRKWSNQLKMQMIYQPTPSDAPPANQGDRYTEKLTSRAVRKIFESGAYVASCHGGFTTFLTLTFSDEQRKHIFGGEALTEDGLAYCPIPTTIGAEVSRLLNSMKKVYERGFSFQPDDLKNHKQSNLELNSEKIKVPGRIGRPLKSVYHTVDEHKVKTKHVKELHGPTGAPFDFHYIWVAECPMNDDGEPNPHVHVLLNWQVPHDHFLGWANQIEKLWGHGMANLQKIKYGDAAAGYLIKAVGYAAKGGNADQGLIKGNRYNIARCSRAPDWEVLASFEASNMASIIKECGYRLERWRKPIEKEIKRKREKRDEAIKVMAIKNNQGKRSARFKLQNLIEKLENEIKEQRDVLKNRGVYARSDNVFSICFDGEESKQKMDEFLIWAAGARDWSMQTNDVDLSEVQQYAQQYYEEEYQYFLSKRNNWQSQFNQAMPPLPSNEEIEQSKTAQWAQVEEYFAHKLH